MHTARPLAVGLVGKTPRCCRELVLRGFVPDVVTDQTSPTTSRGYLPRLSLEAASTLRERIRPGRDRVLVRW